MNFTKIEQSFLANYKRVPEAVYFSPGRVNLIGEHIDYNGGRVMPAAISVGTYFAVARNGTGYLNIYSSLFDEQLSVQLSELPRMTATGGWIDYIVGMLQLLDDSSGRLVGVDLAVGSDMPLNSGLSSSASFAVGFGFALSDLLGLDRGKVDLALAARAVENDFVGVNCGIMDQFAVAMGKEDHCIVLDCASLDYELLPMNLAGHEIVIANSMVPRKLSESNYNLRRSECEQALAILQQDYSVNQLCELSVKQVEACGGLRKHDVLRRRALHASSENARVYDSAIALKAGKLVELGAFMNASHESLRDDFEVSCKELDTLAETAQGIPGVLGSRMTGAGFGGCTVSIVATSAVPDFIDQLSSVYSSATPFEAKILRCSTGDGVKRLNS
jgi:galactokinase